MRAFKICIIGAGSVGFTKKLCADILKVPEFADIEIALTDINPHNLEMIEKIIRRMVEANGLPARVTATTDRREALTGARYVMNCVRIGGLEAFADDIRIPLKYGVDQCVGDTICAGGILYGQRGIAAMMDFARDIREVCETDALLLNYANPMAMMTWAMLDFGTGPHGRALPRRPERPPPDRPRARRADGGGRHRLLRHQPPDLVSRHPPPRDGRSPRTN